VADRILVLRGGQVREDRDAETLLSEPQDSYTRDLLAAAPRLALSQASSSPAGSTP
jgi:peptide/nickel transport system ATP-binding protein